jgi:hypothetical protein
MQRHTNPHALKQWQRKKGGTLTPETHASHNEWHRYTHCTLPSAKVPSLAASDTTRNCDSVKTEHAHTAHCTHVHTPESIWLAHTHARARTCTRTGTHVSAPGGSSPAIPGPARTGRSPCPRAPALRRKMAAGRAWLRLDQGRSEYPVRPTDRSRWRIL